MPNQHNTLDSQVILIQKAMQRAGVWSEKTPEWVKSYDHGTIPDIWQWMQFIYLPMRLSGSGEEIEYLAPKINAYIKNNPALMPILQLTIELDALTPTFQKSKM
jgi:hypothetical protein